MSSKHLIIALLVICIGAKVNTTTRDFFIEYGNFTLTLNGSILSPELTFNDHGVDKMRLVYGLWNGTARANKTCKIIQDTHSFDHSTKSQSCNVDINAINQNDKIVGRVALLNNDTVLILAKSGKTLQLINVQLTSCQTYKTTITDQSDDIYFISVVPDENTYDVIYRDPEICGGRRCKITFDYKDGRIVKNATEWGPLSLNGRLEGKRLEDEFVQMIAPRSSRQGYLLYEHYWYEKKKVYLIREKRSTLLFESKTDDDVLTTSVANNKIGICSQTFIVIVKPYVLPQNNYTLECKQYDLDGRVVKLDMQRPMYDTAVAGMAMLNLPDGFILLFRCRSTFYQIYTCDGYPIMHFDGDGNLVKVTQLEKFDCKDEINPSQHLAVQFFKNSADELCLSHTCTNSWVSWGDPTRFSLAVQCFNISDL